MNEERGLTPIEQEDQDLAPRMVMTIAEAQQRLHQFQQFVKTVMVEGQDYGKIPGVDKPTLLKPGAEKLCEIYGFAIEVDVSNRIEDWERGFFHYEVRCTLRSKRSGTVVATGIGSCNTKEKRYSDRWAFDRDIPDGVDKATLKKRQGTSKAGKPYTQYLVPNSDVFTLVNTVLKMAKKRAMIDAALSATRSSGIWTQDIEDWVEGEIVSTQEPEVHKPAPGPTVPMRPKPTLGADAPVQPSPVDRETGEIMEPTPTVPSQALTCGNPDCGRVIEDPVHTLKGDMAATEFVRRTGGLCPTCYRDKAKKTNGEQA